VAVERFPIEEGHVMAFARAIGDPSPAYTGPDALAPPTFVQASAQWDPDYALRPSTDVAAADHAWWGSGAGPGGAPPSATGGGGGTGLHAEQHYDYLRTPRVGDVLSATVRPGRTWEKEGRRSGRLLFAETVTEYRDQNGELVVIARGVGVRTERPVEA
jgi:hypothetical protein